MEENNIYHKKIIFFDGVCVLCNSFVDRVLSMDVEKKFMFSPLQGETAVKLLTTEQRKLDHKGDPISVIYWDAGKVYSKTNAVAKILEEFPEKALLAYFVRMFPMKLRDAMYGLVATYRYNFFGKKDVCRLPNDDQKNQFLS